MSEEEITIFDIILEDNSEGKIESYICQNPYKIISELENDNVTSKINNIKNLIKKISSSQIMFSKQRYFNIFNNSKITYLYSIR